MTTLPLANPAPVRPNQALLAFSEPRYGPLDRLLVQRKSASSSVLVSASARLSHYDVISKKISHQRTRTKTARTKTAGTRTRRTRRQGGRRESAVAVRGGRRDQRSARFGCPENQKLPGRRCPLEARRLVWATGWSLQGASSHGGRAIERAGTYDARLA